MEDLKKILKMIFIYAILFMSFGAVARGVETFRSAAEKQESVDFAGLVSPILAAIFLADSLGILILKERARVVHMGNWLTMGVVLGSFIIAVSALYHGYYVISFSYMVCFFCGIHVLSAGDVPGDEAVDLLAEVMASSDGKGKEFSKGIEYSEYKEGARNLIIQLRRYGFDVVPKKTMSITHHFGDES